MLREAQLDKLFFLSGGIEPGDEDTLRDFAAEEAGKRLFSVDINSRFEVSAGVKDMTRVAEFVQKLKEK